MKYCVVISSDLDSKEIRKIFDSAIDALSFLSSTLEVLWGYPASADGYILVFEE